LKFGLTFASLVLNIRNVFWDKDFNKIKDFKYDKAKKTSCWKGST